MNSLQFESMVPSELCLKCDICCRFPQAESSLAPFFTEQETTRALDAGLSLASFEGRKSGKIHLVPFPSDVVSPGHQEGCICPAFDPRSQKCSIYDVRPFDCRLYPFALMRKPNDDGIILGIDTKCPFIRDSQNAGIIDYYGRELIKLLKSSPYQEMFNENPGLIGPYQDDVTILDSF